VPPASSCVQRSRLTTVWADIWSEFTGLATESNLQHLKQMLIRIERGIQKSSEVWKAGTSHFLAAFKVEQARMENLKNTMCDAGRFDDKTTASNGVVIYENTESYLCME